MMSSSTWLGILAMRDTYEQRLIARFESAEMPGVIIDTCKVYDGEQNYETGICHPEYNDGDWMIVESYDTAEEAEEGHLKWVRKMTGENLPKTIRDCCNSLLVAGSEIIYDRQTNKKA